MWRYQATGCTDVRLRDQIMQHAEELIRQVIRTHGLHRIYPGREESAFMDLFQTAWCQIERTLYKYKVRIHCADCYPKNKSKSIIYEPGELEYELVTPEEVAKRQLKCPNCKRVPDRITYVGTSKVFNLWSQIARTCILAHIKKEGRDRKNSEAYKSHLDRRPPPKSTDKIERFLREARTMFKHNPDYMEIIDALETIVMTDDRPYEGLIGKLVAESGKSRQVVVSFIKMLRLRSNEFADSAPDKTHQSNQLRLRSVAAEDDTSWSS